MKISLKQKKEISQKNSKLELVKEQLKNEFIGLDDVIDKIINGVRPYYIFPKSLKRPLIINLFGMTATGKTDLVERLVTLLELTNKYAKFDVGEYASANEWKLRTTFQDTLCEKEDNNLVIVLDEIQMGRTIDEDGKEINRQGLRVIWELLDSGKLTAPQKIDATLFRYAQFLSNLEFNTFFDSNLRTADVLSSNKFRRIISDLFGCNFYLTEVDSFNSSGIYKEMIARIKEECPEAIDNLDMVDTSRLNSSFKNDRIDLSSQIPDGILGITILPRYVYRQFVEHNPNRFERFNYDTFIEYLLSLKSQSKILDVLYTIINEVYKTSVTYDLSKSLFFIIGNIDEAYGMSHSSNPDADADLFYEHSLKITQPKIKDALAKRFRMEQIGRMGNNIVIYPAFSSDSYKKIIKKLLNSRVDYFKKEFQIDLTFTRELENILYKESVFPSQGVRPVLSTLTSFIDSFVSSIISDVILNNMDAMDITWSFDEVGVSHSISVNGGSKILTYPVILNIENLRKSDFSENQAYTAIHEAGHALIAIIKTKLIPSMVMSKTASVSEGFCRIEIPDIQTRETEYMNILIALGGRAAEKYILGDDIMLSTGSYSDLAAATEIANKSIKIYGHGNNTFVVKHSQTASQSFHSEDMLLKSEQTALLLINRAEKEVNECLVEHKDLLLEMIDHLVINPQLTGEQIKEILVKYNLEIKQKNTYYNIKQRITDFKNKL